MDFFKADDGTTIAYRKAGTGPEKIVLIHGFNCTSNNFNWMIPFLAEDHYTLLLPDLRGGGHSDKPETGYTLERFARDIAGIIHHEGWQVCSLMGHSTGGAIAQWLAADPDINLRGLILAGPVPATGVPMPDEAAAMFRAAAETAEGKAHIWRMGWSTPLEPALLDTLMSDSMTWRREAMLEMFAAWRYANFPERLPAIRVPTLVIGAQHEPFLTAPFLYDTVINRITGARYVEVPNSSHYMHIEQAAFSAGVLIGFLAGLT
ncbi:MAG: alpha/beta hydrolase [Chloroflexaceae bacterium]|nr:alpha/beta hydrolase [Chloroflexaceae bacterium]NJL33966.1 alpha/beta hydrolase [Chloroflexaceae bacterium]NJO07302.1 alpha/beta hydrolase [Chloroflexaceae bacterium]